MVVEVELMCHHVCCCQLTILLKNVVFNCFIKNCWNVHVWVGVDLKRTELFPLDWLFSFPGQTKQNC